MEKVRLQTFSTSWGERYDVYVQDGLKTVKRLSDGKVLLEVLHSGVRLNEEYFKHTLYNCNVLMSYIWSYSNPDYPLELILDKEG